MFLSMAIFLRLVEAAAASFLDLRTAGILKTAESLLPPLGALSEAVMLWNPAKEAPPAPGAAKAEASARVSADRMPKEDCSRAAADCSWFSQLCKHDSNTSNNQVQSRTLNCMVH